MGSIKRLGKGALRMIKKQIDLINTQIDEKKKFEYEHKKTMFLRWHWFLCASVFALISFIITLMVNYNTLMRNKIIIIIVLLGGITTYFAGGTIIKYYELDDLHNEILGKPKRKRNKIILLLCKFKKIYYINL